MSYIKTLTVKVWPEGATGDELADHLEHVASMLRQGCLAGEVCREKGRGWWDTSKDDDDDKPVRVVVDFSGGVFHGALATVACEVLAIDEDDEANPRATVPGFGSQSVEPWPIWAGIEKADVKPTEVNRAFDGIDWLPDEE